MSCASGISPLRTANPTLTPTLTLTLTLILTLTLTLTLTRRGKGDLVVHFSVLFPRTAYTGDHARLLRNLMPRDVSAGSPKAGAIVHQLEALLDDEE